MRLQPAAGGRELTPNQIVAWNMAYFRNVAGLTQEQLGELLGGWTNVAVSSAERSWCGKRVRKFDADEIATLAEVFGLPIAALFMPLPGPGGRSAGALVAFLEAQLDRARDVRARQACPTCGDEPPIGFTCNTCRKAGS